MRLTENNQLGIGINDSVWTRVVYNQLGGALNKPEVSRQAISKSFSELLMFLYDPKSFDNTTIKMVFDKNLRGAELGSSKIQEASDFLPMESENASLFMNQVKGTNLFPSYQDPYEIEKSFQHIAQHPNYHDFFSKQGRNVFANTNYIFSKKAKEQSDSVKVNKADLTFLSKLSDRKATFLCGKERFFRYLKIGKYLHVGVFRALPAENDQLDFNWMFWKIDVTTGTITGRHGEESIDNYPELMEWFKMVVFFELSDLELQFLKPNQSIGKKRSEKVSNGSKDDIVIINSNWNVITVNSDGFEVSGHFRMQPCGKNRENRKLIYIKPFTKNGYIRRAGAETIKDK